MENGILGNGHLWMLLLLLLASTTVLAGPPGTCTTESGNASLLVVRVNLSDTQATCDEQTLFDRFFGPHDSAAELLRISSYDALQIHGCVITVDIPSSVNDHCQPVDQWKDEADNELFAMGIDPNAFDRVGYIYPHESSCAYCGSAPGFGPVFWARCCNKSVLTHELGHSFNLRHTLGGTAQSSGCELCHEHGAIESASGVTTECDVMQTPSEFYLLHAVHRLQKEWLPSAELLTAPGQYSLSQLNLDPTQAPHPQLYRVFRPNTRDYYYLAFRKSLAPFFPLPSDCNNRIHIDVSGDSRFDTSWLLLQTYPQDRIGLLDDWEDTSYSILVDVDAIPLGGDVAHFDYTGPQDPEDPTLSVSVPSPGDFLSRPVFVEVEANASDNIAVSSVFAGVEGAAPLLEDLTAPYEFALDDLGSTTAGPYNIQVIARDTAGRTTQVDVPVVFCPGDGNGDGQVDNQDLIGVVNNWLGCASGPPCPGCAYDFDGDCLVWSADLTIVLNNWGACPTLP